MAKLLKLRRGTTTQHASFTGAEGEVTVDTTKDTAVVHDGSQAGGRPLAREDMNNVPAGTILGTQLENSGVTAGSYGSSSAIPIVTVDAQGLVTAASTTAIDSTTIANGTSNVAVANNGDITVTRAGGNNSTFNSSGLDVNGSITCNDIISAGAVLHEGDSNTLVHFENNDEIHLKTNGSVRGKFTNAGAQITGNLDVSSGVDVTGNITCSGTVDGVDVAALKTAKDSLSTSNGVIKSGVELASGVVASTQAASDDSTKVATTAYVKDAITGYVFPAGTKMLFQQTSAPTGWTKVTSGLNNHALRVVSGTAGSGGNVAFSTAFASRGINANSGNTTQGGNVSVANTTSGGNVSVANTTAGGNLSINSVSTGGNVNSHTLSTNEMPSHSHNFTTKYSQHNCRGNACYGGVQPGNHNSAGSQGTNSTGGSGGHSHGFSGSSHNHNGTLSGTAHSHNASFSGNAHNHNASFSGSAHNHSISVTNLDLQAQYLDVIIAAKD